MHAQDAHFSQFFAAPLYYNPANTGNFEGNYRIGLNYKDQWGSVTVPYRTYDVYSDLAFQPNKAANRFGFGLLALNDIAGDGVLTTTRLQASAAYHIGFNEKSNWRFALGLSGAYVEKQLDIYKLTFDSQWDDTKFETSLSNNETPTDDNIYYTDFSVGALTTFIPYTGEKYYIGISASHITQPEESFYDDGNKLHIKYLAQAGGLFPIATHINLQPQLFYSKQSSAYEIIAGANMSMRMQGYNHEKYRSFILGAWYRWQDAAWLVAGINMGAITFTLNYDFNISQLTPASHLKGGLEAAFVYSFGRKDKHDPFECPVFE